jgi:hypothetical protein
LTLVSNLVKDSLIYAFQEALKPSVEKLVSGPVFQSILAEELLAVEWNFVYIKDALDSLRPQKFSNETNSPHHSCCYRMRVRWWIISSKINTEKPLKVFAMNQLKP